MFIMCLLSLWSLKKLICCVRSVYYKYTNFIQWPQHFQKPSYGSVANAPVDAFLATYIYHFVVQVCN